MVALSGTVLFYTVLIAPGFIAVMTAITLAAVEDRPSRFVLLTTCVVSSILIDTLAIAAYQSFIRPITSFDQLEDVFFTPGFRWEYVLILIGGSLAIGVIYAWVINAKLLKKARSLLRTGDDGIYNPRQMWTETLHNAGRVRVKTSDNELFVGDLMEWSRDGQSKQLRIKDPWRYNAQLDDFERTGGNEMMFVEEDIARVLVLEYRDDR